MRRHEDRIFALALRMMGNRADALDATQDAFINAFRQTERFRGDAAFGTWLYRIAINACKDLLRKRSRWETSDDETIERAEPAPIRVEDEVVTRLELRDALERLPGDYREAVILHDLGGVPYQEIASITGVQIGTVKSRISRGRRLLGELLEHGGAQATSKEEK